MAEAKRFDTQSIKSRNTKRYAQYTDTAQVLPDGTFENLNDVFSEGLAEVARQGEYLLGEKKFTTAQNMSSLTSMGSLISRKQRRAISSIGYILVSHTDNEGNPRLINYGKSFFNIDEASDYDNLDKKENSTFTERKALVPWTFETPYTIPKGTIFASNSGVQFISTEAVSSRILTEKFSEINNSEIKKLKFLENGGWEGIKYLKVPVIQGIERSVVLGNSSANKFETFSIEETDIEDASNVKSREFFYVELYNEKTGASEKWAEVQNIRLAGPYDKVFESKISSDKKSVIIKFGDDVTGKVPYSGARVILHYLETLGEGGNIDSNFQVTKMSFPNGILLKDPRFDVYSEFLSCTNIAPISGGQNIENEVQYKENAPISYLKSYATAVEKVYRQQLKENSPFLLSKIKCNSSSEFSATQVNTELNESISEKVANEVSIISNVLKVSAIKSNGEKLSGSDAETFKDVVSRSIGENKGPSDYISIVEPNYIKVAPSIKVNTTNTEVSESEISNSIKTAISSLYSVFNTDFNKPLYNSKISQAASNFRFTTSNNVLLEVLAEVDYDKLAIIRTQDILDNENGLLAVPFKFSSVFGKDKYNCGFKNYTVNSPYLLKVDIKFANDISNAKARTLFLYDNRTSNMEIEDVLNQYPDSERKDFSAPQASSVLGVPLHFFNETQNNYKEREVRVAQFPFISNITDTEFMVKATSWNYSPFEIRPYEQDENGNNKYFESEKVQKDLRVSTSGDSSVGTTCFKKNSNYIENLDIIFSENYDNPQSSEYASGWVILPMDYVGVSSYFEYSSAQDGDSVTESDWLISYISAVRNLLNIKVYAQPKIEDITCDNWNDIVFIDEDDIKVERNLIFN